MIGAEHLELGIADALQTGSGFINRSLIEIERSDVMQGDERIRSRGAKHFPAARKYFFVQGARFLQSALITVCHSQIVHDTQSVGGIGGYFGTHLDNLLIKFDRIVGSASVTISMGEVQERR